MSELKPSTRAHKRVLLLVPEQHLGRTLNFIQEFLSAQLQDFEHPLTRPYRIRPDPITKIPTVIGKYEKKHKKLQETQPSSTAATASS